MYIMLAICQHKPINARRMSSHHFHDARGVCDELVDLSNEQVLHRSGCAHISITAECQNESMPGAVEICYHFSPFSRGLSPEVFLQRS